MGGTVLWERHMVANKQKTKTRNEGKVVTAYGSMGIFNYGIWSEPRCQWGFFEIAETRRISQTDKEEGEEYSRQKEQHCAKAWGLEEGRPREERLPEELETRTEVLGFLPILFPQNPSPMPPTLQASRHTTHLAPVGSFIAAPGTQESSKVKDKSAEYQNCAKNT